MTGFGMKKFTEDFKREAVRLVQTSGRIIEQAADDLGIGRSMLGKWLAKHREADLLSEDTAKELARLTDSNQMVMMGRRPLEHFLL